MKRLFLLLLLISSYCFSQSSGITYQAVIYNPNGEELPGVDNPYAPLVNQSICLQFGILDADGTIEYQEQTQVTTDAFGMVNLLIGTSTQTGGFAQGFTGIEWSADAKFLKVDLDTRGNCVSFEELSNQPFTYVPFAYYSPASDIPGPQGEQGTQGQDGAVGATGPQGEAGPQGATGPQGEQGPQGQDGAVGGTGPQGPQGETGPQGEQGETGAPGSNGNDCFNLTEIGSETVTSQGGTCMTCFNIEYDNINSKKIKAHFNINNNFPIGTIEIKCFDINDNLTPVFLMGTANTAYSGQGGSTTFGSKDLGQNNTIFSDLIGGGMGLTGPAGSPTYWHQTYSISINSETTINKIEINFNNTPTGATNFKVIYRLYSLSCD